MDKWDFPGVIALDCCDAFWSVQQEAQPGHCCINEKVVIFIHLSVGKIKFHSSFQPVFVVIPFSAFRNKQKKQMKFAVQWAIMGKISHYQRRHWKLHWPIQLVSGEACLTHRASSPYILSYPTSEEWTSQFRMTKKRTLSDFYFLDKIKNKILTSPLLPVLYSPFSVIQRHVKPLECSW